MGLESEYTRVKFGEELSRLRTDALGAISRLKAIRVSLATLEATISTSPVCDQDDVDEIETARTQLDNAIKNIIAS